MYHLGNMDIRRIHVRSNANIYTFQFIDFLSNIFNLYLIDMKTATIAKNTWRGYLTIKIITTIITIKNRPPLKLNFKGVCFLQFYCQMLPKEFSAITADNKKIFGQCYFRKKTPTRNFYHSIKPQFAYLLIFLVIIFIIQKYYVSSKVNHFPK